MHLSLKGSMDRQPLTDRLGDKLLAEYGGAAAAYSLRSLSGDQTKVVRVRRSSDNAEKDFTASEMGAALEDWVNEDVSFSAGNTFFGNTGATVINATPTAFDATATGGTFDVRAGDQNYIDAGASEVTVNFTVSNFSSSRSVNFEAWNPDSSGTYVLAGAITGNGAYTLTFNVTESGSGQIFRFRGTGLTSGDTISVSSLSLSWTKASGFVETWYDQSGNGNDATQTVAANQPKIVDAGAYLGEIDFDGDDFLPLSGDGLNLFRNVGYSHLFSVVTPDVTGTSGNRYFIARTGGTSARFLLGDSTVTAASTRLGARRLDADSFDSFTSSVSHNNAETLMTGFVNWADASAYLYFNGTEVGSDTNFLTAGNTEDTASTKIAIGGETDVLSSDFKAKEFIIYTSDQSSNRTAIEANINNYYSIY